METLEKQSIEEAVKAPSEDRLVMLSDGIFAIATTLLVLNIKLPDGLKQAAFNQALTGSFLGETITYVITFLVISGYWINHRLIMNTIRHIDRRFIWLNFLFLAFIAFFPVSSSIVGTYGLYPQAVLIYTLVLSGCGFSALFLWLYATGKHRLVDANLNQRAIHFRTLMLVINPVFFLVSLILLFFPAFPAYDIFYTWILIFFIQLIVRRSHRHRTVRQGTSLKDF